MGLMQKWPADKTLTPSAITSNSTFITESNSTLPHQLCSFFVSFSTSKFSVVLCHYGFVVCCVHSALPSSVISCVVFHYSLVALLFPFVLLVKCAFWLLNVSAFNSVYRVCQISADVTHNSRQGQQSAPVGFINEPMALGSVNKKENGAALTPGHCPAVVMLSVQA